MRKSILVAMDQNNGIGYQNRLPWHLPAELKRFKALTMGHHLILGRKTYESIGKPLPGRTNIIVTRNCGYQATGCMVTHSVSEALALAESRGENEVFICGGSEIYRETLQEAGRLYLTRVHAEFQIDTSFPNFDVSLWREVAAEFHPADEKNPHPFTFYILERKS
ncbi:MAG TPA: dihydrofolate reductase [Chloroflexi bacterium]|nr:dihydrofolate reductase [Chloroflexota bacterium]HBY06573.1 dihydrofolate reductase [Chloroflexota bacterium]